MGGGEEELEVWLMFSFFFSDRRKAETTPRTGADCVGAAFAESLSSNTTRAPDSAKRRETEKGQQDRVNADWTESMLSSTAKAASDRDSLD